MANPYDEQKRVWQERARADAAKRAAQVRFERLLWEQLHGPTIDWGLPKARQPISRPVWCDVLGVAPDASRAAITAAYRRKAKETHPDVGGSPAAFQQVQRAYERAMRETIE